MRNIYFNDKLIAQMNPLDVMYFMKDLATSNFISESDSVSINRYKQTPYTSAGVNTPNDLMTCITIDFQVFRLNEMGEGTKHQWVCNRAKDFSCQNRETKHL